MTKRINYFKTFLDTLNHPFNQDHKFKTIFRLVYWKLNQLFFHLPAIVEIEKGIKVICYPESSYGSMVVYNKWPEYEVIKTIVDNLEGKDTYIDVGANFGDTTLVAAAHTKGKIYAFEPSPAAYPQLLENIRLNDLTKQVIPLQKALADKEGKLSFTDELRSEVSHLTTQNREGTHQVETITLDDFAKQHQLKEIKLVKIDVEGAEHLVLMGAKNLLKKHQIKNLILELNPDSQAYGYLSSETVKLLNSYGYHLSPLPTDLDTKVVTLYAKVR